MSRKFIPILLIPMLVMGIVLVAFTNAPSEAGSPSGSPSTNAKLPGGHTKTAWTIEGNPALDALCFIPSLTGDQFYLNHYQSEYNRFAPKLTPAVKDALAQIKNGHRTT